MKYHREYIPWLGCVPDRSELHLDFCLLSGSLPVGISALSKLTYLSLTSNAISSAIPDAWTALSQLQSLNVYPGLIGTIPSMIGAVSSLRCVAAGRRHCKPICTVDCDHASLPLG